MPTTMNVSEAGCVTWLAVSAGTSAPDVAVNFTPVPTAPAGDLKPRATASLSLRSSSVALSDLGRRPAVTVGSALDEPSGGSEISSPEGGVTGAFVPTAVPAPVNVPDIPTWPQAARTCGRRDSVARVAASRAGVRASATG